MSPLELISTSFKSLLSNKGRTLLTMLGIMIGIASVISMLAIGNGAQQSINSSISALGSNLLTVTSSAARTGVVFGGAGSNLTLTLDDAKAIKTDQTLQDVAAVSPELTSNAQAIGGGNNTNTTVNGVVPEYATIHNYQVDSGNFITQDNDDAIDRVAVLGPTTATNLFGTDSPVGQTIKINKIEFHVIGVTKSKGSSGFTNSDDAIFVPLSTAQKILFGQTKLRTIVVQGKNASTLSDLQSQLTTFLEARHHITGKKTDDFTIINSADTLSTLSSVTGVFTILLASIGGISLVVGGIGIMNIMIVTVTERTKEIGLRKAVGAKNQTVLTQFLTEAVILTLLGGLAGVGIGYLVAYAITALNIVSAQVTISSVILSVGVSVLIGVVFGLYPAYKAARLSPIDALKYE